LELILGSVKFGKVMSANADLIIAIFVIGRKNLLREFISRAIMLRN
jgi:hypothetical protein